MLARKNLKDFNSLYHETFHLFQDVNGLPMSSSLKECLQALELEKGFAHFPTSAKYTLRDKWVRLPLLKMNRLRKRLLSQPDSSPAKAMRVMSKRELETFRFLIKHHNKLWLPYSDLLYNQEMAKDAERAIKMSNKLDLVRPKPNP